MQQISPNVLVVFAQGGPAVGELRRVDLVGLSEDLRWFGYLVRIILCDLLES